MDRLWFNLHPGLGNKHQRDIMNGAGRLLDNHGDLTAVIGYAPIEPDQPAMKVTLSGNRLADPHMRRKSGKTFVVGLLVEATVEAWRSDLEQILVGNDVLDIEGQTQSVADIGTVIQSHPARLVDEDLQYRTTPAGHLGMHKLKPLPGRDPFNYLL